MINRDKNRANVIIWSIAKETPRSNVRDKFLSQLSSYAKSLDNTRLISMAMEVTGRKKQVSIVEDNMNQYVDIISINEYYGWYRRVKYINRISWEIAYNKPIIITEFGGEQNMVIMGIKIKDGQRNFKKIFISNS